MHILADDARVHFNESRVQERISAKVVQTVMDALTDEWNADSGSGAPFDGMVRLGPS